MTALPFDLDRLPRTLVLPGETEDGQPFDLYYFHDEFRGDLLWHRVTSLIPLDYSGFHPWVTLVCRPDADDCWNVRPDASLYSTTIPTEDRCPDCFGQ